MKRVPLDTTMQALTAPGNVTSPTLAEDVHITGGTAAPPAGTR